MLLTLKFADLEVTFFFPTVATAWYWPSALTAVATVVIFHEPLLDEVVLSEVLFQTTPLKELIVIAALAAGFTCP
ncbi:unannotated protein [freshwater metagenome]|uniref:Unannotated protein n=1 Tax=freshwater metagenome TaxID=449393 RepID=A0A6J5ZEQ7_9ZZZZ